MSSQIIVPLDVATEADAIALIDKLPEVTFWKVGLELFVSTGANVVKILKERQKKVFLDLKLHDIPNTVAGASREAARYGVDLLTIHSTCGREALTLAHEAIQQGAIEAGVTPDKLYLHGNNKSVSELNYAIASKCTIVVDNWQELHNLVAINASTRIMLRLTPGIECHTHEYIRTGHLDSKFGFDPNQLDEVFAFVSQQECLNFVGFHAHIGSQIFERQPHQDLGAVMVQWIKKAAKYSLKISELNVGGGLGIRYTESDDPPSIDEWVQTICHGVKDACVAENLPLPKLLCEPGRSLVGSACITAYTIGSSKVIPEIRTYIAVDGGMSDNPRPITYQSVYRAVVANKMSAPITQTVTVAGKHCESGDIVIKNATLPTTNPGDILVVMATGAYNYSMASNYNRLPRPAAVLVNQGEANLILQRETYQDLIRQDRLPERLNS